MSSWARILIGFGILLAAYYIIGIFGGNIYIDLAFILIITPVIAVFMFGDKDEDVNKKDEES